LSLNRKLFSLERKHFPHSNISDVWARELTLSNLVFRELVELLSDEIGSDEARDAPVMTIGASLSYTRDRRVWISDEVHNYSQSVRATALRIGHAPRVHGAGRFRTHRITALATDKRRKKLEKPQVVQCQVKGE